MIKISRQKISEETRALVGGASGIPGNWSSKAVADALQKKTGFCLLWAIVRLRLESENNTRSHHNMNFLDFDSCRPYSRGTEP